MVGHQKILHLIGTTYRLRTPKTGLGEGGGRGKRNLKANSFKRKSEKVLSESVNR